MKLHGFVILAFLVLGASCTPPAMGMLRAVKAAQALTLTPTPTLSLTATPVDTPTLTPVPTRTPRPGQVAWHGDLHMHTTCSDGAGSYEQMAQRALALHLDFIAITDHVGTAERECHNASLIQCKAENRLLCIPGAELTGRLHLLAIGIQQRIDPKLPLKTWISQIHAQGGLAIAAHPYDKRWKYSEDELVHSKLDGMECARGTAQENQQQWLLADKFNLPCVYNSDAHYPKDVGWRHNECSVPINSLADLRAALLGKKCKMN